MQPPVTPQPDPDDKMFFDLLYLLTLGCTFKIERASLGMAFVVTVYRPGRTFFKGLVDAPYKKSSPNSWRIFGEPITFCANLVLLANPPQRFFNPLWIDYWAVDWYNQGDTFHNEWQTYRTRKSNDLQKQIAHTYDEAGEYAIVVKVIDILGNDTTKTLKVKVA